MLSQRLAVDRHVADDDVDLVLLEQRQPVAAVITRSW
jgi:hypothetical protein